jgi:hypothetical protein
VSKQSSFYGPAIGNYMGKPIFQSIRNQEGTFVFDRLAHCDEEGCPLDQLAANEVMFAPGLIYRSEG